MPVLLYFISIVTPSFSSLEKNPGTHRNKNISNELFFSGFQFVPNGDSSASTKHCIRERHGIQRITNRSFWEDSIMAPDGGCPTTASKKSQSSAKLVNRVG